jgi:uncharacterized alpha/beta hydrolase family protein
MKKSALSMMTALILVFFIFLVPPSSQAQTREEKEFMERREKEMTTFMEKCTGCHSAQRILAKKASKEEWDKILKVMVDKPHANISAEELDRIQKWSDFMKSTITPRP